MDHDDRDVPEEETPKPTFWSFDGFNFIPTSAVGWVLLAVVAIGVGVVMSIL